AKFNDCKIKNLRLYGTSMGAVELGDSVFLSPSLIKDRSLMTLTGAAGVGDWSIGFSSTLNLLSRVVDPIKGEIIRLNPSNISSLLRLDHKPITAKPNAFYAVKIKSSALYPIGVTHIARIVRVIYQDAAGVELSNQYLYPNRSAAGT